MGNEVPTGEGTGAGPGTKGLCLEQSWGGRQRVQHGSGRCCRDAELLFGVGILWDVSLPCLCVGKALGTSSSRSPVPPTAPPDMGVS